MSEQCWVKVSYQQVKATPRRSESFTFQSLTWLHVYTNLWKIPTSLNNNNNNNKASKSARNSSENREALLNTRTERLPSHCLVAHLSSLNHPTEGFELQLSTHWQRTCQRTSFWRSPKTANYPNNAHNKESAKRRFQKVKWTAVIPDIFSCWLQKVKRMAIIADIFCWNWARLALSSLESRVTTTVKMDTLGHWCRTAVQWMPLTSRLQNWFKCHQQSVSSYSLGMFADVLNCLTQFWRCLPSASGERVKVGKRVKWSGNDPYAIACFAIFTPTTTKIGCGMENSARASQPAKRILSTKLL